MKSQTQHLFNHPHKATNARTQSLSVNYATVDDGNPYLSVLIPVYNEREVLPMLYERVSQVLNESTRVY